MKAMMFVTCAALAAFSSVAGAAIDLDDPGDEDPTPIPTPPPPTTPPPPPPAWEKKYTAAASYGDDWGAGWTVQGRLAAYPKTTIGTRDKLVASASLDAYARIAGSSYSLFRVNASGTTQAKYRTDVSYGVYLGGATVYSNGWASATSTLTFMSHAARWPRTFVDRSVTVGVGPIPVTFRVNATGELAANLSGKLSNVGVEIGGGPSGKAALYASAAVGAQYCVDYLGCVGASAGVYADVTLVEIGAPATVAVWWSLAGSYGGVLLNFLASANINIQALKGDLGVFAEACLGGCLDWSRSLIDWDGLYSSYPLHHAQGKYCLVGPCVDSFQ
jgi:hypothetical protein